MSRNKKESCIKCNKELTYENTSTVSQDYGLCHSCENDLINKEGWDYYRSLKKKPRRFGLEVWGKR